jgi:hypothetical protein
VGRALRIASVTKILPSRDRKEAMAARQELMRLNKGARSLVLGFEIPREGQGRGKGKRLCNSQKGQQAA